MPSVYGGCFAAPGCTGPEPGAVLSVLTVRGADGAVTLNRQLPAALPVDVAVSADGSSVAAVAPGKAFAQNSILSTVFYFDQAGSRDPRTVPARDPPPAGAVAARNHLVLPPR